ncbi:MAG: hypothetical protein H5U22_21480 [Rhizobium sp.]|nr:hypothetical protein [Rhizobium sp.]
MPSSEYQQLEDRLQHLAATLPATPVIPTPWTQAEADLISAFAVFGAAACEHYIEERCGRISQEAYQKFYNARKLGRVAKHLCITPFVSFPADNTDRDALKAVLGNPGFMVQIKKSYAATATVELDRLLRRSEIQYKKALRDNHGIGVKHYFKLLGSIGVNVGAFDVNFVNSLQRLWELRGGAAHRHVVAANLITPTTDMRQWTTHIITGFTGLDSALDKLRKATV